MSDSTAIVKDYSGSVKILDKALADVKYRIGSFLTNEKILYDIKPRIDNLVKVGSPQIQQTAKVLSGKWDALLSVQKSTEGEAIAFMTKGGELKTKIDTDPLYSFTKTPQSSWGLRQYQILAQLAVEISKLMPTASGITARLLAQNKNVTTLVKEVVSTEKAAAGTGLLPKIEGIISGTLTSVTAPLQETVKKIIWPIAIAGGVGLVAYLLILKRK
jgi:hypothetical protein